MNESLSLDSYTEHDINLMLYYGDEVVKNRTEDIEKVC